MNFGWQNKTPKLAYDTFAQLLLTAGNPNLLYFVIETQTTYYWNGYTYIPISITGLPSGALTNDITDGAGWNANTNTPTITSGVGTEGDFAIVSVAGTTTIDGISSWAIGDYIWWDEDNSTWQKIDNQSSNSLQYEPLAEPVIVTGTPNTLTIDMQSNKNALFEPRLSSGTRSINVDFDLIISNDSNGRLLSIILSLTGTRTIQFDSDVLCSNPSTLGIWNSGTQELQLVLGTNDIVEFQLIRDKTGSKWILKVSEVAE